MTAARITHRFVVLRGLRWLPLGVILPFAVLLPQARGLSLATVGALWAVHSVVIFALEVPSGALADSMGRRRVLVAGGTLMTASLAIFAFAEGPAAFAVALAALAAGRALTSGALEAWFVDSLRGLDPAAPLRRGLSRGTVADGVGMAAGAIAGGVLPLAFGGLPSDGGGIIAYTPAALAAAAAAAGYVVAVGTLVDEPKRAAGTPRRSLAQVGRAAAAEIRASSAVRTLLGTSAAFGVALSAVEILWQPRLAELLGGAEGHSLLFGILVAGSMAAVAAGALVSPRLTGVLGLARGYVILLAVCAATFVALALAGSPLALALAFLAFYGAIGLCDPLHNELLNEGMTDAARATVLSAESLTTQVGAAVSNVGLAALAHNAGVPTAWFAVAGVLGAGSLLALRLTATPSVQRSAVAP